MRRARVRVDETDLRILREVFAGEGEDTFRSDRPSLDAIADRLGLHRNTVSARYRRLLDERVFLPATLDVEPAAFGLVAAIAFLDAPRERRTDAARDAIFALPGAQILFQFVEGWEIIAFAASEPALFDLLEEARRILGASTVRLDVLSTRDYPPVEPIRLTRADARILRALLRDSRAGFPAVAREAGVTATTVKRRYERLRDAGAIYLYPASGAPIEGVQLGFITIGIPDPRDEPRVKKEIAALLPDFFVRNLATRGGAHFLTFAPHLEELEAQAARARSVPGVAGVELRVFTGLQRSPRFADWLADVIERRAREVAPVG